MPRMRRLVRLGALAAALTCCNEGTNVSFANLIVYPILDSLFAGDNAPARNLIYINDRGDTAAPVGVRWSSDRPAVVQVDYITGALTAVGPGAAVVSAQIGSTVGLALVVVSKTLDLQLLLDTIYLMPGDTFTVPVDVKKKGGGAPPAWFKTPTNAVFSIDSATGLIVATSPGGPVPFFAHADTLVDTGAVQVVSLSDTIGGMAYFTILGTYIARRSAAARGLNYLRRAHTARILRPQLRLRPDLPAAAQLGRLVEAAEQRADLEWSVALRRHHQHHADGPAAQRERPGDQRSVLLLRPAHRRVLRPARGVTDPRQLRRPAHHRQLALHIVTSEEAS